MSDIRSELQRAVDDALASVAAGGTSPDDEQHTGASEPSRRRLAAGLLVGVLLVGAVGAFVWVDSSSETVRTGPANDSTTTDVPVPAAPRATSFTLDMPERFIPAGPTPESRLVDGREPVDLDDLASTTTSSAPRPKVTLLTQNYLTAPDQGAVDGSVIIELSYADEMPDGLLEFTFDGQNLSDAAPGRPLVRRVPANRSGGLYADWLDGTNYVMFMAEGMTEAEFDAAIDSFSTQP